ncbi:IS110 family transposase [Pseudoalteromonas arctica]|uniref:IS110 family transposase n=2 Tax=Pseudoalteromonas arctica TaxID=394751 RepID=A0A7Y0DQI6_9GAMM|nr:IS110 family transposase [Pseudoalteromonas arctica]NMM39754.1 IS110 family transposase [Pseudoalteromonas arctica]
MYPIKALGIDLAKLVFSIHGVDEHSKCKLRKTVKRNKLLAEVAKLPPCIIGMEACSGAHYWAREFTKLGHDVRIMTSKFVIPYRQNEKNDANDAEAIGGILEDAENNLPFLARELLNDLWQSIKSLNEEILKYDRKLYALANQMKDAKRLMSIPGIGEITATAVVATVNDAKHFDTSRSFAAWIGLVPRQYATGGVVRLGRISKRGEKHIRTSLIHGARAVIANCKNKTDRTSMWVKDLVERRGFKRATVALAAKNARLIWALLHSEKEYQVDYVK